LRRRLLLLAQALQRHVLGVEALLFGFEGGALCADARLGRH
jgi:hypothetical protein